MMYEVYHARYRTRASLPKRQGAPSSYEGNSGRKEWETSMKKDAVIIGGGIIGCATAYYLARAGKRIALIEQSGIGEGTSGACDGFVMMQSKEPGLALELAMRSAELYQGLEAELGYETQYRRKGGLVLIETEEMRAVMERVTSRQAAQGMEVEFIDNARTRALEPLISDRIAGAVHCPLDGDVSPIHTTRAYAKRTAELGGELMTHTLVTGLRIRDGQIEQVETTAGSIETNVVVNAAGAWASLIGEMAGVRIPVKPRRGHLLVTEALSDALHKELLDARYIAIKHDPSLAENTTDETLSLGVSLSVEQTLHGNLLIGGNREFAGFDTSVRPEVIRAIAQYCTRFVPALKELNVIRSFIGLRPYCEDGKPIVGPVSSVSGLYLACGHEGDGIALAPVTGLLVAQMILGEQTGFDLTPFSFDRFGQAV